MGSTHFKLQLWLLNLFSFSSSFLQGKHQNVPQDYCYSQYHLSASAQPSAEKEAPEVFLRKFADDAQIDRTINYIYISENSVSCCTALRAHVLSIWSMSTNFSVSGFHSPPTCKSNIGFWFSGVWPSPFMCVQTHCLNEFPFLPNNPAVYNWFFLNTVYHSTKLCIICKLY